MKTITAHFDGSCQTNPGGRIGYGAVVGDVQLWGGDEPNPKNSNNTAEHRGLNLIFNYLDQNGITDCVVIIMGDSDMVIKQMTPQSKGGYKMKPKSLYYKDGLKNIEARNFLVKHNRITFTFKWIPREQNTICDDLSNRYYQRR